MYFSALVQSVRNSHLVETQNRSITNFCIIIIILYLEAKTQIFLCQERGAEPGTAPGRSSPSTVLLFLRKDCGIPQTPAIKHLTLKRKRTIAAQRHCATVWAEPWGQTKRDS